LAFEGLTPMLGERLAQALRATGKSPVSVEVVPHTASLDSIQARLRQWLAESDTEAVPLTVLPTQHWMGLGLLRPQLAIPHEQFAPVAGLYTLPAGLSAHAALGVRSAEALAERLRQRPHQLPGAVLQWGSASHWLAMLWAHRHNTPMRWRVLQTVDAIGHRTSNGEVAWAFAAPHRFGWQGTHVLMPLGAWQGNAETPGTRLSAGPLEPLLPHLPEPCFTVALVPQTQAWKGVNQERHLLLKDWLQRAMKTEPMRMQRAWGDQGDDVSGAAVSVVQLAADRQRRAFEAAPVQRLEGGRS